MRHDRLRAMAVHLSEVLLPEDLQELQVLLEEDKTRDFPKLLHNILWKRQIEANTLLFIFDGGE